MKQVLRNIFRPDATITSTATVTRRLQAGQYEVVDSSGRLTVVAAESSSLWPAGVAVVIQNDRIIGGGHRLGKHRVVEG